MKVTTESTENSQVVLQVEVEPEEMEKSLEKAYKRIVNKVNIPGFRKGKAPRTLVERYIGREALVEEALEPLIPEMYGRAIEEQKLEPLIVPQIEIVGRDPAVFKAKVVLRPPVKIGDYHSLSIPPQPVEVTQEQVDKALQELRERQAVWEPVERAVASGDLVIVDVQSTVEGQETSNQKGVQYIVTEVSAVPVAGFAEQLAGMAVGQEKEFELIFPAEHSNPELAGKSCAFKVTLQEVKEKKLPELDDAFAQSLGEGFTSLEDLRQRIFSNLLLRAQEEARAAYEEKVIDSAVEMAELELPPLLVEHEVDHLFEDEANLFKRMGGGMENYLKRVGKTEAQMKEELQPAAAKRLMRSLVISEIGKLEKIGVTPEEVDAEIEKRISAAGQRSDEMRRWYGTSEGRSSVERYLPTRKTLDRLIEVAQNKSSEEAKKE